MSVDITDITKAVMSEGPWHIVPTGYVTDWVGFDRESVIVHACPEWERPEEDRVGLPDPPGSWDILTYWTTLWSLNAPCERCNMRPPEAIAGLWTLHNFDAFAGENTLSRFITEAVKKAEHVFYDAFVRGNGVEDE